MGRGRSRQPAAVELEGTGAGPAWLVEFVEHGDPLARSDPTHTVWLSSEIRLLKRLAKPRPIEAIAVVKRVFPGAWAVDAWRVGDTARPSKGWHREVLPSPDYIGDEE